MSLVSCPSCHVPRVMSPHVNVSPICLDGFPSSLCLLVPSSPCPLCLCGRARVRIDGRLGSGGGAMVDLGESTGLSGTALISGINPAKMGPERSHAIARGADAFLGTVATLGDCTDKLLRLKAGGKRGRDAPTSLRVDMPQRSGLESPSAIVFGAWVRLGVPCRLPRPAAEVFCRPRGTGEHR
jgi:hypothetical protein